MFLATALNSTKRKGHLMTTSATTLSPSHVAVTGKKLLTKEVLKAELTELGRTYIVIPYYLRNWCRPKASQEFTDTIKSNPELVEEALLELIKEGVFDDRAEGYMFIGN